MCDGSGCSGGGPEAALMTIVFGDTHTPSPPKSKTNELTHKNGTTILAETDQTRFADGINERRIIWESALQIIRNSNRADWGGQSITGDKS